MIDCTSPGNWISSSHLTDHFLPGTGAIPDRTGCGPKGVSGRGDWCPSTSLSGLCLSATAEPSHSGEETQASPRGPGLSPCLPSTRMRQVAHRKWVEKHGSERKGSQRRGGNLEMPTPQPLRRLYGIFIHRKTK